MFIIDLFDQFVVLTPHWGAADAEIKVPIC